MIKRLSVRHFGNERGGVLAFVALALAGVVGMSALAVDLGMLYTAREEAQRAADSAALAGASAFLSFKPSDAVDPARTRAYEYALRNEIRQEQIDSADVTSVQIDVAKQRVTVVIRRQDIPLWFARILGVNTSTVSALAAAEAVEAGTSQCLKPFALPDLWDDADNDPNGNNIWDFNPFATGRNSPNELWQFDASKGDRYKKYTGEGGGRDETGYGGGYRDESPNSVGVKYDNDFGRQVMIKSNDPSSALQPGVFYPWRLPMDPAMETQCKLQYGGTENGGKTYAANICNCNNIPIAIDQEVDIQPGNMIGPTQHGLAQLLKMDPHATWDADENRVVDSEYGDNWMASPRVIKIGLMDPTLVTSSGMQRIKFNNFALLFIEDLNVGNGQNKVPIVARFLRYVSGSETSPGQTTGSLIKTLRLVK